MDEHKTWVQQAGAQMVMGRLVDDHSMTEEKQTALARNPLVDHQQVDDQPKAENQED